MTQLMTADPVSLDEEQRRSLSEQIAPLGPGEALDGGQGH
jgi:hypothetical protein